MAMANAFGVIKSVLMDEHGLEKVLQRYWKLSGFIRMLIVAGLVAGGLFAMAPFMEHTPGRPLIPAESVAEWARLIGGFAVFFFGIGLLMCEKWVTPVLEVAIAAFVAFTPLLGVLIAAIVLAALLFFAFSSIPVAILAGAVVIALAIFLRRP